MEKEPDDEILSKRKFQKAAGVDLGNFLIGTDSFEDEPEEEAEEPVDESKEVDVAMGEMAEMFSRGDEPSRINRDGTVNAPPEVDTVTEYAIEGEKRLHLGLMISMVVVWSAIGAIVAVVSSEIVVRLPHSDSEPERKRNSDRYD